MPNHRTTQEEYIRKCREVHGNKYDYSKTIYTTSRDFLTITCPIHGDFIQRANTHLSKKCGCQECNLGVRKTTAEFVKCATEIHGSIYDYSLAEYTRKQDRVKIICHEHGIFLQRPSDHLSGSGCPSCAKYGFNENSTASIYILESDRCIKIGITNRDVDDRVWQINNNCKNIGLSFNIFLVFNLDGITARKIESEFKEWAKILYKQPDYKFDGYTECFINTDYRLVMAKLFELMEKFDK